MDDPMAPETPEAKKALFRRLVDLYAVGDLDSLDGLMAPGYVGHPSTGDRDLEGFKESIRFFHTLYTYDRDSFTIEDQLVEGDKVATRMTAHVRLRETGEPVTLLGINIAIIRGGRLVEEWNTWEQLQRPA
ncbi:MAG: ester cyclase [Sphingomonadaceae bacterium]